MKQYLEISIDHEGGQRVDILIAELDNLGFYAFQEEENILKAYILPDDFQESSLQILLDPNESFKQYLITEKLEPALGNRIRTCENWRFCQYSFSFPSLL